MAKILFLTQIVPFPPDAGPKVKTYHVLRALLRQGHSVTLVSFVRQEEKPYISDLDKICDEVYAVPIRRSRLTDIWYMLRSYLTGRPFLIERDDLHPMRKMVDQLVERNEFQFIHADQLTMVQFAFGRPSGFSDKKPKIIFDAHNAVWTIIERMQKNVVWLLKPILIVEMRRVKRYEGELLKTVDHVLTVTDVDRAGLEEALSFSKLKPDEKAAPITVIPIAVDTNRLQPIQRDTNSNKIITLGTLHYPPNADGIRWFFNEVFPLVQKHIPDAKLIIIGKNPPPDFLGLAAQNPRTINVTGYVEDLVPYMQESILMVVPVRAGGGMRVRILEAFAFAMPVVTTTIGLEGISAVPNHDVLVADDPDKFANLIVELMRNVSLQEKLASNGRKLAEDKYDWQVVLKAMEAIYGQETE